MVGIWKRERQKKLSSMCLGLMALGSWYLNLACPRIESWGLVISVLHAPGTHGTRMIVGLLICLLMYLFIYFS